MKRILGLDLGTNSIGWALVEIDHEAKTVRIVGLGSRILSMDAGEISKFESGGKLESAAAKKTQQKGLRKQNERFLLRRDRLHCVLNLLNTLPPHYQVCIDFETEQGYRSGKFKKGREVKLAYERGEDGKQRFLFMDPYNEMLREFREKHPDLFGRKKNGKEIKIPFDWALYYLRKKALTHEISKEELAWVTLSFNQKRGYEKTRGQDIPNDGASSKAGKLSETYSWRVGSVLEVSAKGDTKLFDVVLIDDNGSEVYRYKEESSYQITFENDLKEVEVTSSYDEKGDIDPQLTIYKVKEIRNLRIIDVRSTGKKVKENSVFEVELATGWIKDQQSKYLPPWKDTERDFIIKTDYDVKGNRILKGSDKGRNMNTPSEDDWTLLKLKTEMSLSEFNEKNRVVGVASFIYTKLFENPNQKINGGLITVIDRKYYREELEAILKCQKQFHSELRDPELYQKAINLLYPNNESHRKKLAAYQSSADIKDDSNGQVEPFSKLLTDDIIFYQRDLKSKKSTIADCSYEKENFKRVNKRTGKEDQQALKAIHKANPLYQEFRIWQFIKRLKIICLEQKKEQGILFNQDVSNEVLTNEAKEKLFGFLNNKESITQAALLKHLKLSDKEYKWNYESDHREPCNETRYNFIVRLKRIKNFDWEKFLTPENEYRIWHFFYSVKKQEEFQKGIRTLFGNLLEKTQFPIDNKEDLIRNFIALEGYSNDYGSYSEKALKKLLPFLRLGKYWDQRVVEELLSHSKHEAKEVVLQTEGITGDIREFQGLWISSACYLVYGRYSEVGDLQYWRTPEDIEHFLRNDFKQHSLKNPVVERVLVETLQLVKDIWKHFGEQEGADEEGNPRYKKLFDQIHIELAKEMRKNAKEKEKENSHNKENKKTNDRILKLLAELKKGNKEVNAKSPFQQAKLRILEDDLLSAIEYDKETTSYELNGGGIITKKEIKDIVKKDVANITPKDMERYRLWLDQRYQSPYTGKFIKLSDLFDREKYEIEHIFPQERVTLNALYNKVICEKEVNKEKKARTGYQFIVDCKGMTTIECAAYGHQPIPVLPPEQYEQLVRTNFTDKRKQEILLSQDIPDSFTNSQLDNTRYISKMAMKLLSNIVREDGEDSYRSRNVLAITGGITARLRADWQLNDTWNELIRPRFERLNDLTNSDLFGTKVEKNGHEVFVNRVPEVIAKDFDKKRIDHRHHAMDALIAALSTESHVNYLNNFFAQGALKQRFDIKERYMIARKNEDGKKSKSFLPPAQYKKDGIVVSYSYQFGDRNSPIFKLIVLDALQHTIVSFKQKTRIIRQRTNRFQKWNNEQQCIELVSQEDLNRKRNFCVRQSLHKVTFYGKVKLRDRIKTVPWKQAIEQVDMIVDNDFRQRILELIKNQTFKEHEPELMREYPKLNIYDSYLASRYNNELETLANVDPQKIIPTIGSITDIGIQKILIAHLAKYPLGNTDDLFNPEQAFSPDGVRSLNNNIRELNNGKNHKPIYKVRRYTTQGTKFPVSDEGSKSRNYVVTDGGSNLFCGFYENKDRERKFLVPTLRETIASLQCGEPLFKEKIEGEKANDDYYFKFILLPNDLVFVPTKEERDNPSLVDPRELSVDQKNRIYKLTDGTKEITNFVKYHIAKVIVDLNKLKDKKNKPENLSFIDKNNRLKDLVNEIGLGSPQSKNQNSIEGEQIKSICWKLEVDRLGNIQKVIR